MNVFAPGSITGAITAPEPVLNGLLKIATFNTQCLKGNVN